jgi:hypothetical protein
VEHTTIGDPPPGRRRTALMISAVVAGVVAVIGGVLGVTILPPAVANLTTRVASTDGIVAVGPATVPVPAGWSVQHPPFQDGTVVLTSPDGALAVTVAGVDRAGDAAVAVGTAAPTEETLASGLEAVHTAVAPDALTVMIARPGAAPAVAVAARAATGDIAPYTRALAQLLDGILLPPARAPR